MSTLGFALLLPKSIPREHREWLAVSLPDGVKLQIYDVDADYCAFLNLLERERFGDYCPTLEESQAGQDDRDKLARVMRDANIEAIVELWIKRSALTN
jgi:hypothetical protein